MRMRDFKWDDGNELRLTLWHGIEPEEAEEVLAGSPVVRKTKKGHYAAFGPTLAGRLLVIVIESCGHGVVRVITGWDMKPAERRYFLGNRNG